MKLFASAAPSTAHQRFPPNPNPRSPPSVLSSSSSSSHFRLFVRRRTSSLHSSPPDDRLSDPSDTGFVISQPAEVEAGEEEVAERTGLDRGMLALAKAMPMFEPQRTAAGSRVTAPPLKINLELWLHRAKVLIRKFEFADAEPILLKCIQNWPEDGRAYVALGKLYSKQSKFAEARKVYEKGCQATQGENSYIWQCWAVLESKFGNVRRARELFDAATVADKKHVAAWHGWAVLEIRQGNIKKARNLLAKGLKFAGANEYIYQTLAQLEARAKRFEQARFLLRQATQCSPSSCASWLAWAQLEIQQGNFSTARKLFERAVQASPKNRYAWQMWALFEADKGYVYKAKKLLKIGHALNPRDPVILQSLALLEYKNSSLDTARILFRKASRLDPRHQPIWVAWGWMEWKEGNDRLARKYYQTALSINSTTESAARCLQAWGVLEERAGNFATARRLFRSSLDINSQSYVTWAAWALMEEQNGNPDRAEEIRNLYFQQRTEVVDDASWVFSLSDMIDPALDSIKRLLSLEQLSGGAAAQNKVSQDAVADDATPAGSNSSDISIQDNGAAGDDLLTEDSEFDIDAFIKRKLSLDPTELDVLLMSSKPMSSMLRRMGTPNRRQPPSILKVIPNEART